MDQKNLAIGVLSVTAVVLLVGNVILHSVESPAFAAGMTTSGGDYILTVGRVQSSPAQFPEELLYVIDTVEGKLIAYSFDAQSKKMKITSQVDLKNMASKTGDETEKSPDQNPPVRPGQRQPTGKRQP